jgi:acetolactate synthase-1/2/3 large subunit
VILGFVQTGTENTRVIAELLRDLVTRGLRYEHGLLVVIDGITIVIDNNSSLGSISQQQMRLFGSAFKTKFRDIPFHRMVEGLGGYGELVESIDVLKGSLLRAIASGKPACVNVRTRSVASPLIEALTDRRAKASIE